MLKRRQLHPNRLKYEHRVRFARFKMPQSDGIVIVLAGTKIEYDIIYMCVCVCVIVVWTQLFWSEDFTSNQNHKT